MDIEDAEIIDENPETDRLLTAMQNALRELGTEGVLYVLARGIIWWNDQWDTAPDASALGRELEEAITKETAKVPNGAPSGGQDIGPGEI